MPAVDRSPRGHMPTVDWPKGHMPAVDRPKGHMPTVDWPRGHMPTVDWPRGHMPAVDRPRGHMPAVDRPCHAPHISRHLFFWLLVPVVVKWADADHPHRLSPHLPTRHAPTCSHLLRGTVAEHVHEACSCPTMHAPSVGWAVAPAGLPSTAPHSVCDAGWCAPHSVCDAGWCAPHSV